MELDELADAGVDKVVSTDRAGRVRLAKAVLAAVHERAGNRAPPDGVDPDRVLRWLARPETACPHAPAGEAVPAVGARLRGLPAAR